ncbi:MAG: hypothetical protein ACLTYN_15320 [Dysosmobacter welbionis]
MDQAADTFAQLLAAAAAGVEDRCGGGCWSRCSTTWAGGCI